MLLYPKSNLLRGLRIVSFVSKIGEFNEKIIIHCYMVKPMEYLRQVTRLRVHEYLYLQWKIRLWNTIVLENFQSKTFSFQVLIKVRLFDELTYHVIGEPCVLMNSFVLRQKLIFVIVHPWSKNTIHTLTLIIPTDINKNCEHNIIKQNS